MKITIKKLSLTNFKGIKSLSITFDNNFQAICGDNGTGKSTIADAISWLLFGKDQHDRKDFEVKTVDQNGVIIPRIEHEVCGEIYIDTVKVVLKRILREKWVKKSGTNEQVFTGNETLYFVDDVPKSQRDYQDYINQIIPEQTFKLLTNPSYFNALKWQERRAMLTAIAKVPTDVEIAGTEFSDLLETMTNERKSLEDLKAQYSAQKRKLQDAIKLIPARLDELHHNTPEAKDWKALEKNIKNIKSKIARLDEAMTNRSKSVESAIKERSKKLKEKADLEYRKSVLEDQARRIVSEKAGEKNRIIADLQRQIELKRERIKLLTLDINDKQATLKSYETSIAELRVKFKDKNAEVMHINDINDTCPTCKQLLPEAEIQQQKNIMAENFAQAKIKALAEINAQGKAMRVYIDELNFIITEKKNIIANEEAEIISLQQKINETNSTPSNLQSVEAILNDLPEYQEVIKAIPTIIIPEVEQVNLENEQQEKATYQAELEVLQRQIALKDQIDAANIRRGELLKEEESLANQITDMEGFEYKISQFQSLKMKIVEDSVNKMFKNIKFRMFETQINGGIVDACTCLIGGVPYSDANNAGRINAGLEIIDVFGKHYGISAPIAIDNAESVTSFYPVNAQIIGLYVVEGSPLEIKKPEKVA